MLQYQHFNLLFLPFDLDLEVPHEFSPFSLDRPLTTKASSEEVSRLDFFLNSVDNNRPTTLSNDIFIILVLYVDDMLIVSKNMDDINRLKEQTVRNFDMKDLGVEKQILGIEIHTDRRNGKLSFSQEKYVEKILVRF